VSAGGAERAPVLDRVLASPGPASPALRYGLAVPAAALGLAAAVALGEADAPAVFAPALALIALAIWLLGLGPTIALTSTLALLTPLILDPRGSFDVSAAGDVLGWALFIVTAAVIVLLGTALRRARDRSARAATRSAFLAEASLALDAPASVEERLEELTRLAVPALADWCAIDLVGPRGEPRLAAVAHSDPERVAWARTLRDRYPPDPDAPTGLPQVLRTGRAEFYPDVSPEMLEAAAQDAEHLEVIRQVGFTSALVAPLLARGRTLGALTLVTAESGRRLTRDDLALAEELARRAALALDLATLYRDEVEASSRLERLQRVTAALAQALTHQQVADAVIREGRSALDADAAALALTRGGRLRVLASAGYAEDAVRRFAGISVDTPLPGTDAVRESRVVALGSEAEVRGRYPAMAGRDPGYTAVLAAPLLVDEGPMGFLGFSFREPREFDDDDSAFALTLAQVAAGALARAELYEAEHDVAQTLQRSLLPRRLPEVPGLDLATRYRPLRRGTEVGGDFFDVFPAGEDVVAVIGDVCGKGVEAAALTALARHSLRILAGRETAPHTALTGLNAAIIAERGVQSLFLTAALARLRRDGDGWRVTVACAGHPLPVILSADGGVRTVGRPGPLLGPFPDVEMADAHDRLAPGETLVLYTDGVTETRRRRRMFGEGRLAEVLSGVRGAAADDVAGAVEEAAVRYHDGPLADDLALVVLQAATGAAAPRAPALGERAA